MGRRLHYFAQPFWKGRRGAAQRYEFRTATDAEEGGAILARSADGVLVYRQWIDAEAEVFDDAELLVALGHIPSLDGGAGIDGAWPDAA